MKHTNIAKTDTEFSKELEEKRPDLEKIGFYVNNKTKIKVRCKECKHEWLASPSNLLHGTKCPECSKRLCALRRITPLDKMQMRLNDVWGNLIEYLCGYVKTHEKCWWQCNECGNIWQARPHDILAGHGCKKCADRQRGLNRRLSETELIHRIKLIHGDRIIYVNGLVNTRTKALFHCNECNSDFWTTPQNILSGCGCKKCGIKHSAKSRTIPVNIIIQRLNIIYNGAIILDISTYKDTSTKCKFYCTKHGEFWATPHHVLAGHGCSICGHNHGGEINALTLEEVIQRLWELYHGDIVIDEESFIKLNEIAIFKCNICGNIFTAKVHDMIYIKRNGCPVCIKISMERPVLELLHKKGIIPLHDKALERSNYNGSSHPLRADFYIETSKGVLVIETDGRQHFEISRYSEPLEVIQARDRHKDKYCKEHNICLIRVTSSPIKEWGFKNHITLVELLHLIEIGIDSETGEIDFELFKKYDFNRI